MALELAGEPFRTRVKVERLRRAGQIYPLELRHSEKNVNMIAFNASETLLASCSADYRVNLYNAITFRLINQFKLDIALKYIAFTRSGFIVAASIFSEFFVLDAFGESRPAFSHIDATVRALAVSPGDVYVGLLYGKAGNSDASLVLYDLNALLPGNPEGNAARAVRAKLDPGNATKFIFFLDDRTIIFAAKDRVWRAEIEGDRTTRVEAELAISDPQNLNAMTLSPRADFLILSCERCVRLIDPLALVGLRTFPTEYPAKCAQISALAYAQPPLCHLFIGGGIEAVHQASSSEAGNEVIIYDFASEASVGRIQGFYACINWLLVFKDGSGFVTAGEEGACRVYRFDAGYYSGEY